MKEKANFLILGIARSGTTMLQKLLDSHSAIAVCPESDVFTSLYRTTWRGRFPSDWHYRQFMNYLNAWLVNFNDPAVDIVNHFLAENETYRGNINGLLSTLVSDYLQTKNKSLFGEKTPQNIYHIPLIRSICPNVNLIILMRHPYDVICSIAKLLADNTGEKNGRLTDNHFLQAAVFVRWGLQSLSDSQLASSDCIKVKYEDLLVNPSMEMTRISHFLGIDFESKMLHFQTDTLLQNKQRMNYLHPKLAQEIDPNNTGKYRYILNESQEQLVYRFLGATLKNISYNITDNQVGLNSAQRYQLVKYNIRFALHHHLWKDEIIRFKLFVKYMMYLIKKGIS